MLGEKRNASLFQEEPTILAEPFRNEPSAPREHANVEPAVEDKFPNLQFGPGVDVISGKGNPKPAAPEILAGRFQKQEDVSVESEPCAFVAEPVSPRKMGALRTHDLFFSPEESDQDFPTVLREVQEFISKEYSELLTSGETDEVKEQIKRYITKYVQDHRLAVKGMTAPELVDAIYTEMAEFSFLTKYIYGKGIEEIDGATRS